MDDDRNPSPHRRAGAKSCAALAIGDCVALCCFPCAVVNCFVLAFRKCDEVMLEIVVAGEGVSAEELWIELAEIGHLGFGRISSAGINYYEKGN
ncbi:hypothetical protein SASPL_139678 [Salvia splendens]|uniref:Uncharacterized protein n=1 Tax=Salvia splendens TaxID=180675 RepID=A0A8X8WQ58_SALSN|nr:hypothetical protein SASPL_139678 [Salvia splendens]